MGSATQSTAWSITPEDQTPFDDIDTAMDGLSAFAQSAGSAHDLGNLIQIASSTFNRLARHPTISTSDVLGPIVAGGALALNKAGEMVRRRVHVGHRTWPADLQTDVRVCLDELDLIVRSTWEPGSFRLELRIEPEIPAVLCNRQDLQDALLNLLLNARDAMPDGGVISLDALAIGRVDEPMVRLRVMDRGIGMTPETMRNAFEPFFTTKGMGLGGVGLPMVRHFVEGHGGTIRLESALAKGTIVTLQLPGVRAQRGTSSSISAD